MPADKWSQYEVKPSADKWDKYAVPDETAPGHPELTLTGTRGGFPMYHGTPVGDTGVMGGAGSEISNAVKSPFLLFAPPSTPEETAIAAKGPGALAAYRMARGEVTSRGQAFKQAGQQFQMARGIKGDPTIKSLEFLRSGVTGATGVLPVPGIAGMATNLNRVADTGNLKELWGRGLIDAALLALGLKSPGKSSVTPEDYLTGATGTGSREHIVPTWEKVKRTAQQDPNFPGNPNLKDYANVADKTETALNNEYGNAIGPHANQQIMPSSVSARIRALITPNLQMTKTGRIQALQIEAAAREFEKPWSLKQLDQERIDANARSSTFKNKGEVAQYSASRGSNRSPAIDDAIASGIRQDLYPILDRVNGKPSGYYAGLKDQVGNLMHLRGILKERIGSLQEKTSISKAAPRFSSEDISVSVHPGSAPRAGFYGLRNALFRTDPYKVASKQVSKAFSPRPPLPIARAASAAGMVGANQQQEERTRTLMEFLRNNRGNQ